MIAGTFFKELAENQDVPASKEKKEEKQAEALQEVKQPFIKVKFERCCVSVEVSMQKQVAAQAMSTTIDTALKPFKALSKRTLPGIKGITAKTKRS